MATYAVSDLHGQYDLFEKGLKEINFSDKDFLYVIGDAIDRGPAGIKILQHIMNAENMDFLLGNHEIMMLDSVASDGSDTCNGNSTDLWLWYNGGAKTFEEYCTLSLKERQQLLEWLNNRYLIKVLDLQKHNFVLTHSYYIQGYANIPYKNIPYQDADKIVWNSMFRRDYDTHCENIYKDYPECTFITGHVAVQYITRKPCTGSYRQGNFINIDGGLAHRDEYFKSSAIFYNLDEDKEFIIPYTDSRVAKLTMAELEKLLDSASKEE